MTNHKSSRALIVGICAISLALGAGVLLEKSCQSQTGGAEGSRPGCIEPAGGSVGSSGPDSGVSDAGISDSGSAPGSSGMVPGSSGDASPGGGAAGSPGGGVTGAAPPGAAGGTSSTLPNPGGPDSPVSSDGDTVSYTPSGPPHEWTREEMLLARPMGMSGEERQFDSTHKAPETIRSWTLAEFDDYVKGPLGQQSMLGEGQRWISLSKMLRKQEAFARAYVAGKKYKDGPDQATNMDFLPDKSAFAADKAAQTFENLKSVRSDIATLCQSLDQLSKKAEKQGKLKVMEEAMSGLEY